VASGGVTGCRDARVEMPGGRAASGDVTDGKAASNGVTGGGAASWDVKALPLPPQPLWKLLLLGVVVQCCCGGCWARGAIALT